MIEFGLIGYPLKNTFSAIFFSDKFKALGLNNHIYQNYPLADINKLAVLLASSKHFKGFNVTTPHKQSIIPYLHSLSEEAQACNAVNCIKAAFDETNKKYVLKGFNTDVFGFSNSLKPLLKEEHYKSKALIIGTGGAARAVAYSLKHINIPFQFVGRQQSNECLCYDNLTNDIISQHLLIVQCTPLGMFPDTEAFPILPYKAITKNHLCYDLIYLPEQTAFLKQCKAQGATTKNGLEMLHLQAEKSWEIWNN